METTSTNQIASSAYSQSTHVPPVPETNGHAITPDQITDFRTEFQLKISGSNTFGGAHVEAEFTVPALPIGRKYANCAVDDIRWVNNESYDIKILNYSLSMNIECIPHEDKRETLPSVAFFIADNKLREIIVNVSKDGIHTDHCYNVPFYDNAQEISQNSSHFVSTHVLFTQPQPPARTSSPLGKKVVTINRKLNDSPHREFSLIHVDERLVSYPQPLQNFLNAPEHYLEVEERQTYDLQQIRIDTSASSDMIHDAISKSFAASCNVTKPDSPPKNPAATYLSPLAMVRSPSNVSSNISTPSPGTHSSPYSTPLASRIFEIAQTLKSSNSKKFEMGGGVTFELVEVKEKLGNSRRKSMWTDIKFVDGGGAIIKFKRCTPFRNEETLKTYQEKWKKRHDCITGLKAKLEALDDRGEQEPKYKGKPNLLNRDRYSLGVGIEKAKEALNQLKAELGRDSMPEKFEDLPDSIKSKPMLHTHIMEIELHPAVGHHDAYFTMEEKQRALKELETKCKLMPKSTAQEREARDAVKDQIRELKKSIDQHTEPDGSVRLQHHGSYVRVGVNTSSGKTICEQTRSSEKKNAQLKILDHLFSGLYQINTALELNKAGKERAQKEFFENYFSALGDPMLSWGDIANDIESRLSGVDSIIQSAITD
jgi:hypothetical protein